MIPKEVEIAIRAFSSLPSIGPRQATRLAFYLLQAGEDRIRSFEEALTALRAVQRCSSCFFFFLNDESKHAQTTCAICANPARDQKKICIVEKETDLMSIEKARRHDGVYFVLGGHLVEQRATRQNTLEAKQRLARLKQRIKDQHGGKTEEIIIAISPTGEGDLTAQYLKKELSSLAKTITRLGRGIPTGGDIEFADEETLAEAFKNRG